MAAGVRAVTGTVTRTVVRAAFPATAVIAGLSGRSGVHIALCSVRILLAVDPAHTAAGQNSRTWDAQKQCDNGDNDDSRKSS